MATRPFVDFQQAKRIPLPDVLAALGIADRFQHKGSTKLQGQCPIHPHKSPTPNYEQFKADLRGDYWVWHCFSCKAGGDCLELVRLFHGYDHNQTRKWFAHFFGDRLTLTRPKQKGGTKNQQRNAEREDAKKDGADPISEKPEGKPIKAPATPLIQSSSVSPQPTGDKPLVELPFYLNLDPETPYLKQRGVSLETCSRYEIGLCRKGMFNGYIAMPIFWHDGADWLRVGYVGRWAGDDFEAQGADRWKLPKDFPKHRVVFGLRQALEDGPDAPAIIVVENAFSVFHLRQNNFLCSVALLGSALSDAQAELLVNTGKAIVLLFDGDEAGANGMCKAAAKLIHRAFVRAVKLPDGQQPDRISSAELTETLSFLS